MKIAIALFFTALVCVAQAQPANLSKSIDETLQKAEEKLQHAYKYAREKVESGYELVQDAADNVIDRVRGAADKVQDSIQKEVDKLAQNAAGEGVDVSSCTGLVHTFGNVVDAVINDTGSCVTGKLQQGKDILTDVLNKGQESLDVITSIRTKAKECIDNTEEHKEQVSCLVSLSAKSTWALTTKVPAVAKDFVQAVTLIQNLPSSLSSCAASKSVQALAKQGKAVVSDVKKCITDRTKPVDAA